MSATTDTVDSGFEVWWPIIQAKQAAFFAANGRYWQGLPAGDSIPADGEAVIMNRLDDTADTESICWRDLEPQLAATPLRARPTIHEYGPSPAGYYVILEVMIEGALWRRKVDCGQHPTFNRDWAQVPALP